MHDQQDLHRCIGALLKKFSAERIIQAVQDLDDGAALTPTISDIRMPQQKRNMTQGLPGDMSSGALKHGLVRKSSVALQDKLKEVIDDWVQALEKRMQTEDIHGGGDEVKEEESLPQTKISSHAIKRSSPALDDETGIKRSRSRY